MPIVPCEILESGDTPTYPCAKADSLAREMTALIQEQTVDSALHSILPDIATQPNEKRFPVFRHFAVNPNNVHDTALGAYSVGPMFTGSNSGIVMIYAIPYLSFDVATLHTHPKKSYSAPSAEDIYELISKKLEADNFLGTFVVAADSSQYALTITDYDKARSFFYTQDQFLDEDKWNENSEIGKAFRKVRTYYENKYDGNYNRDNLAYEMAMAAVLSEYNTGIALHKKDPGTGNFKPLVVKTTTPNPNKPNNREYKQECL